MAFLCPVRMRRNKKKKGDVSGYHSDGDEKVGVGMGRITGSASIETLVRVGLEKEAGLSPDSKMIVLQDFTPCVDDELGVKRGNVVNVLYQENDWVYVIAENGQHEGFIPHSYCAPYNSQLSQLVQKKKIPREQSSVENSESSPEHNTTIGTPNSTATTGNNDSYISKMSLNRVSDQGPGSADVYPFFKDPSGRYIVLYTFIARDENDVSVERGEFVTVLNKEDPEWFWIVRSDGQEGFVPSGFVYPADVIHNHLQHASTGANNLPAGIIPGSTQVGYTNSSAHHRATEDMRFLGTELVMLYDYKAQAPDDLSVRRGDWIYADLSDQTVEGWLWAYSPKTRKHGFIPKAYARVPAMTSL